MSIIDQLENITLQNGNLWVGVLNYGARTTFIKYHGVDLALYYPKASDYVTGIPYVGAIVGRVANRIAESTFEIDGKTYKLPANEGRNQLHGGPMGVSQQIWSLEQTDEHSARLTYKSSNGEEGYPANVDFQVDMIVEENALEYQLRATSDAPTPINLAQHSYYKIEIETARLRLNAAKYTPVDREQIPTGETANVAGTEFDLQTLSAIPKAIDHNLILNGTPTAYLETQGVGLTFYSDQLGLQVYSGAGLSAPFEPNSGLALEPQFFPNAVNEPNFKMPLTTPEAPYFQKLRIEFSRL